MNILLFPLAIGLVVCLACPGYAQFVGIGTAAPTAPLTVFSGTSSYLSDAGQLNVASGSLVNRLVMGYDETINVGYINAVQAGATWRDLVLQGPGNGRVGIKTATPATALHAANALTLSGGGTDLPDFGGTALYLVGYDGAASTVTSGRMIIGDGTGKQFHISLRSAATNTDLFTFTDYGQFGIGVAAPQRRLEVAGPGGAGISSTNDGISGTDWIALNTGGATGPRVVQGALGGVPTLGGHNQILDAWTSLNLNPGGNVGVGVTTPIAKLDVGGSLRVADLVGSSVRMVTVDVNGILGTTPVGSADNLGNHIATQNVQLNGNWLSNDGGNEGVRVDNDGRVGVNALPLSSHQFSVQGPGGIAARSTNDGVSTTDWIALNVGGATGPRVVQGAFDGVPTLGGHNQILDAWTNLNLNPGGNVGIGTATPAEKLDVNGNVRVAALAGSGTRMVTVSPTGVFGTTALPTGDNLGNHTATQNIQLNGNWLSDDGGNEGIRVDNTGRVGVNVAAPSRQFEAAGTGGASISSTNDGVSTTDWIALNTGGATGPRVVQGAYDGVPTLGGHNQILDAWTNLNLNPGGNVGIGTATPAEKLDVNGNVRVAALAGSGTRMVTVSPTGVFGTTALPTGDNLGNHTATQHLRMNDFWISNDGTAEGLRIDNDGRVGVNFVPPFNHQLSVNGVGGAYISTTNPGSGTSDWIALNAGGAFGGRLVGGLLNGLPTIGGHNAALTAWEQLLINPGGAQVKLGGTTHYDDTYKLSVDGTAYAHNLNGVKKYVVNGSKEGYLAYAYNTTTRNLWLRLVDESFATLITLASIDNITPNASIYISINKNNAAICTNSHLFNVAEPIIANNLVHYLSTDLGCPGSANVNIEITVVYK